jgi:hypothetical protein
MSALPFVDPYACEHEPERIVSNTLVPDGDWLRWTVVVRCGISGALIEEVRYETPQPGEYYGPNFLFRDYYVREIRRSGDQRRSVYLEIVGTGRTLRIGRKAFERERSRA